MRLLRRMRKSDNMENNQVFSYRYSAKQNKEVENIRKKYMPKEVSKIDMLKQLDYRVQSAGQLTSLTIGVIGCLIFGIGMCFGLGVFEGQGWVAVLFCALGAGIMIPAYPVFKYTKKRTKAKLVPKILQLTEEIMKSNI